MRASTKMAAARVSGSATRCWVMLNEPRRIADTAERSRLISSLRVLSNVDVMQALEVRGVLYVEGHTDIAILRVWAARLDHRAEALLATEVMSKQTVFPMREGGIGACGIKAREHFEALQLVRNDLPGLELVDGDAHHDIRDTEISGAGFQRLRWRRYEIESYLLHPDSLVRFVCSLVGADSAASHVKGVLAYWRLVSSVFVTLPRGYSGEADRRILRVNPPLLR